MVKELDGNWDGVEIRVVRAIGEVLDFRWAKDRHHGSRDNCYHRGPIDNSQIIIIITAQEILPTWCLYVRVNVQPPADGAKWGSIIPATGRFCQNFWRISCKSNLHVSANTSARFTGLTGDMVHARFDVNDFNYKTGHNSSFQQDHLFIKHWWSNDYFRKQFGFCNLFITPGLCSFFLFWQNFTFRSHSDYGDDKPLPNRQVLINKISSTQRLSS